MRLFSICLRPYNYRKIIDHQKELVTKNQCGSRKENGLRHGSNIRTRIFQIWPPDRRPPRRRTQAAQPRVHRDPDRSNPAPLKSTGQPNSRTAHHRNERNKRRPGGGQQRMRRKHGGKSSAANGILRSSGRQPKLAQVTPSRTQVQPSQHLEERIWQGRRTKQVERQPPASRASCEQKGKTNQIESD
jgi:hypothetical protein